MTKVNDELVSLFPLVAGTPLQRRSREARRHAARTLARIHREGNADGMNEVKKALAKSVTWSANTEWNWPGIDRLLCGDPWLLENSARHFGCYLRQQASQVFERQKEIRAAYAEGLEIVSSLEGLRMQTGIVHGDFYARNVLAVGDTITGVVDWDECAVDRLAYEVACAAWQLCKSGDWCRLEWEDAITFVEDYAEIAIVSQDEWSAFPKLLRLHRIVEILASIGDAVRGEYWYPAYTIKNLDALPLLYPPQRGGWG